MSSLHTDYVHGVELNADFPGSALPIAVCVPAHNEAAALPQFIAALSRMDCRAVAPTLCLLLDRCTDASAAIVRHHAANIPFATIVEQADAPGANAGVARHRAMRLGLQVLGGAGILLTTDADSAPAPDWLQAMAAGLRHAEVVAGKVIRTVTNPNPPQDRVEAYYDALNRLRRALDPVAWEATDTHHYTSGANLGFHAESYWALGGFAPLASGEDAQLVDEAERAGLRVRRDAASVVYTSDRRLGRVAHGLAGNLRVLDRGGEAVVAHPLDAMWQYSRHAAARLAFWHGDFSDFAAQVGLTIDHVVGVARDCPNGAAFAMRVVPTPPGGMRRVSLGIAEGELAAITAGRRAA